MLRWNEVRRMPSICAPGFQFTDKLHHRWISYGGKTFRGFPLGPHGKLATLDWVDWLNNSRLLASIGYVPPVACEEQYYHRREAPAMVAGVT